MGLKKLDKTVKAYLGSMLKPNYNFTDKLKNYKGNCLLMIGEYDPLFSIDSQQIMQRELENSSLETIPQMAHAFMYEKPEDTLKLIEQYLVAVEEKVLAEEFA